MCGHRFKEHTKASHKCSNGNCKCAGFFYIIAEGAWILRCRCKHKHIEHDCTNPQHKCLKPGCKACTGFDSPFVCNCDHQWSSHEQVAVTITPSLEAKAAFSEVCGGGGGVQRGGVDLSDVPMALMGASTAPALASHVPSGSVRAVEKPPSASVVPAAARQPAPSAMPSPALFPAHASQQRPLALSRSANDDGSHGAETQRPLCESGARAAAAQGSVPPSRIPSYGAANAKVIGGRW